MGLNTIAPSPDIAFMNHIINLTGFCVGNPMYSGFIALQAGCVSTVLGCRTPLLRVLKCFLNSPWFGESDIRPLKYGFPFVWISLMFHVMSDTLHFFCLKTNMFSWTGIGM